MMSDLRRAAEAVVRDAIADEPTGRWGISRLAMSDLRAALSAPDELAEAREIIARLLPFGEWLVNYRLLSDFPDTPLVPEDVDAAREFLKRTGAE